MKRFLALATAVVFVLGFAAIGFAANLDVTGGGTGLKIEGYYMIKGVAQNNADLGGEDVNNTDPLMPGFDPTAEGWSDDHKDHKNFIYQRVRVGMGFVVSEDATVNVRADIAEGNFDGTANTKGDDTANEIDVDLAWLTLNALGFTWDIGLQPSTWGNGFWVQGATADRIKMTKSLDNGMKVGFHYTKVDETLAASGGEDVDGYTPFIVIPVGEGKLSALYVMQEDHGNPTTCANPLHCTATERGKDGSVMDIAYAGKAGPVNIAAEYIQMSGEGFETYDYGIGNLEDPMGFFVAVNMDVTDAINIGFAYATAANGYVADDNFSPTLMFGTDTSPNALFNFGGTTITANTAALCAEAVAAGDFASVTECKQYNRGDDSTTGMVLSGKFKISDDLSAGANIAQANLWNFQACMDALCMLKTKEYSMDVLEIDLYANYKLATNTNLYVGYARAMPDMDVDPGTTLKDDPITTAAWSLKTSF